MNNVPVGNCVLRWRTDDPFQFEVVSPSGGHPYANAQSEILLADSLPLRSLAPVEEMGMESSSEGHHDDPFALSSILTSRFRK